MKALTNILTQLLMLMLLLVACTEETAEVETLSRQQLMVDMQVSGMKATTRAGEEETINTVTALVFRNDVLTSVEKMVKLANSNNFVMNLPQSNDVIHFLANLPDDVVLPTQMEGSQQNVLTALYTEDEEELSYWGMTTYYGGNQLDNVQLYRNMAMITIEPAVEDAVFTQEQLKIAGLVNANTRGMLVPYKDAFNFDLGNIGETDYLTLPDEPNPTDDEAKKAYGNSVYVFEHLNNFNTLAGDLHVICEIDNFYYKVALADDNLTRYPIIRNHKYIIRIADVCDVTDDQRANSYSDALTKLPIYVKVEDVDLSLKLMTTDLQYSATSTEEVTLSVTIPPGVNKLAITATGFTVSNGSSSWKKESDGVFTTANASQQQNVNFKLTLNSDSQQTQTITVVGTGDYVNSIEKSIQINVSPRTNAVEGEIIWWQGAMVLDASDDATKLPFPYSYFTDNTSDYYLPVGSSIRFNYTNIDGYANPWIQAANPKTWSQIGEFEYVNNFVVLPITSENLATINELKGSAWNVEAAFVLQGAGRVLNQITLIPAVRAITADTPTPTSLYYNSSTEQTVTVNVTIPSGVTALNIKADDFSSVKQGNTSLEKSNGVYVYTRAAEKVAIEETIPFVLTLNRDKFSQQQNETSTNIIFSDGSSVEENAKATQYQVSVTLKPVPVVSFQYDANNTTLYWNNGNPTSLQVNMNNVPQNANVTVNITNAAAFTITSTSTSGELTGPVEGVYTYTGGNTSFIIKPASEGSVSNDAYPIGFSGSGENITVEETNIIVTVEETPTSSMSVTPTAIINLDKNQTSATLTLKKPADVTQLKITLSKNYFDVTSTGLQLQTHNDGYDFYIYSNLNNSSQTIDFVFTLKNGVTELGDYTITFYNNGNQSMFTTATISLTRMFVYNNKTLYLKDYLGYDDPTSLKVTFNAPSESSTLSISAGGFNVSAEGGQITGNNGTYTYTGGPTVFTFTPTETGTNSIVFDGTDIVDTTIDVKVEEKREIFIYNDTGFDLNGNYIILNTSDQNTNEAYKSAFTPQAILIVDYICKPAQNQNTPYLTLQTNWNRQYGSYTYNEDDATERTFEYTFSEGDFIGGGTTNTPDDNIKRAGLKLVGTNVTITKIRIIPTK